MHVYKAHLQSHVVPYDSLSLSMIFETALRFSRESRTGIIPLYGATGEIDGMVGNQATF